MMKKFTLLVTMLLGFLTVSNAQIGVSEGFNASTTVPAGWANPNTYFVSATQACSGNSIRKNLYDSATTAVLTTPNYVGASNGTDVTFSFDYKIVNWSAATVATPAGWGNTQVQYSIDAGGTWTTAYTIDDTNHVVANTCANVSFTIPSGDVPSGSDLQFRFNSAWTAGDYYFYLDNISISQETSSVPNCDAALTFPINGATNVQLNTSLVWSAATGVATGYNLTVGSSPGGNDVLATTDVGNVTSYSLTGLAFETTYYVSIVPYNLNGDASGCTEYSFTTIPVPAPGNLCENPIVVTLPYTTTDNTSNYADLFYEGSPGATGCGTTSSYLGGNDVVYSYTATNDGTINIVMTTTGTWSGMFVYANCASIGSACIGGGSNTGAGGVTLNEFPVVSGQTYYIVISTWPAPQTLAYTLNIVENTCTNATATYSVVSDCDNGPQFFVDVNVTDLGTASSLTISDNQGSATQSASATGVVQFGPYPNATSVIFTVTNDQDSNCVVTSTSQTQAVCPPSNDLCSGAIDLGTQTSPLSASTVGATNNNTPSCSSGPSPDVYYSLVVPNGATLTIEQTVNSYDSVVSMFYGDCSTSTAITCYDDPDTQVNTWANTTGSDQTVYFVVDGYGTAGQSGTFTLAWSVVACSNATATYTVVSDCANAPQFFVDVNVTNLGTATSVTIADNQSSASQNASATGVVQFGPYPNGTSVLFTIANDQDASCTITSAAQTQAVCPPDCANATALDCNTDTVADFIAGPGAWTFQSAFPGPGTGCNYTTPGVEKMYSFTPATTGIYNIEVTAASTTSYVDYLYKDASGSCDTTGWTCIDDIYQTGVYPIGTLTAGTEYLILLDSETTTALSQTFKIVCPLVCVEPTATFAVVNNCTVAPGFFVTANITNLGSATSLTVSDNQASATQTVTAAGLVQFGPYALGTPVVLTLTNNQLTTCTLVSASQTQADCPPSCATLTTPANLATNVAFTTPTSGIISLAWTAPTTGPVPTNYTIMWGTSIATMVSLGNTPNTGVNITNVPYNTTFYWSAVPNFAAGSVTGCAIFSFTSAGSPGYCLNGAQWPVATFVPTCSGAAENITIGGWAGEYSRVTVTSGVQYTFTSSVATDFITIGNAAGTAAIVYGTTPLTWTSDVDGDIRFYTHLSDGCETAQVDRTRSISCPNLATDTFDNANFTYRPNPVVDVLNLQYNKAITSVAVYNIVGQQVITKTVNANMSQVDMSALPSGTYMVKVTSNNEVKTIKVVKE
jgi:hypothetical protein